jgi:hypothetical protein
VVDPSPAGAGGRRRAPAGAAPAVTAPDREVVIGVSRDLANGTEDPFFVL